ncbi:hypothetical protein FMM68_09770 [Lachnospiraceae bacterium MD329]|nr:hypothetical protein [Lachnospiraceae bacterium MD329]
MNVPNKKYWTDRAVQLEQAIQENAEPAIKAIQDAYLEAIKHINADMKAVVRGLSKASAITEDEAEKLLNEAESRQQYKDLIRLYDETENERAKKDIALKINRQAYGARMTRIEALKQNVYNHLMHAQNKEMEQHKTLHAETLQHSYYSNIHNIAKGFDVGINFSILPQKAIDKALSAKWLGSNYSQRVWNNNRQFTEKVQRTITDGITAGHSIDRMANKLLDYVSVEGTGQRYITERLVRTETAHFMAEGQLEAYKEAGIEHYQFVASFDERTCDFCGGLDGEIIPVSEARAGDNYPPLHANCRCTTVLTGLDPSTRLARDPVTGKNYKVDGNMTYNQWKDSLLPEQKAVLKYVDKSGKSDIMKLSGGNMYRKHTEGKIEPMPKKQLNKIVKGFKKNGGIIMMSDDVNAHLVANFAEGVTLDAKTIMLVKRPGRAAVFEELIHSTQFRQGKNDLTLRSRIICEIEAQEKLINNSKAYKLTEIEIEQTKKALEYYISELQKIDEGGI